MSAYAWVDLRNRTTPRLDAFASTDAATLSKSGVTYWRKPFLYMDYCESRNGYVCQRPAAAGLATEYNGEQQLPWKSLGKDARLLSAMERGQGRSAGHGHTRRLTSMPTLEEGPSEADVEC